MAKAAVRARYLLTCKNDDTLNELADLVSRGKTAPALVSSSELKKAPPTDAAVVNKGIRVVSVPLTAVQERNVKAAKLCVIERDLRAFACVQKVSTVEAAVRDYPYPWGIKKIDADIVWEKTKGKGVRVALLDTGVDAKHRNLKNNVKRGVSFVENVSSCDDDNGHGTHCAGILAAHITNNGEGIYGVAPEASVYPVKVLNYVGTGFVSTIAVGLEWCFQNKIDVVSMSFRLPGGDGPSPALKQACERLWEQGCLLVAAVGNDLEEKGGKELGVGYPGRYNCVLGVGATNRYDTIAEFSNRGKGLDLVAPGVAILSTYRNNRYRELSGTSQACPHVAGVAALLKAYRKSLTNEEIKRIILETADPLGSGEPDEVYGRGLVNATGAIEQLDTIIG